MFQLRMHALQQVRVPDFLQPDRGGVPGEPDHQLGRDPVGQPPRGAVGHPGHPGRDQSDGGVAPGLPRLQGQSWLFAYSRY